MRDGPDGASARSTVDRIIDEDVRELHQGEIAQGEAAAD
jgi:hypothetical protein